jgi:hypothetical protein
MGRRSRRRDDAPSAAPVRAAAAGDPASARPRAPWHPFPLVELCVLVGLVLCVAGFLNFDEPDGRIMLLAGMVLASLAGLDTAVREHFAGFRSHSTLLAGLPSVLVAGTLYFVAAPWPVLVLAAAAVFAATVIVFRNAFRRRSGGLSFRVR